MESTLSNTPIVRPAFRVRPIRERGFTLIEMLVVLAIITVITAVAIAGQGQFNRSILLTDTAYTVALSVRQAQTLGLSSRAFISGVNPAVTNTAYGVHFANGIKDRYQLFVDLYPASPGVSTVNGASCPGHTAAANTPNAKPGNCIYDTGVGQDGLLQTFTFNRGFTIGSVCGHVSGQSQPKCLGTDYASIDVSFLRPNTQTVVIGTNSGGVSTALTDACIHISSPDYPNTNGNIYVSYVGEVAVIDTCP